MIENLTNDNFAEKTAQGLTFTDFWATWCGPCRTANKAITWCGPCRMQGPVVEQLSEELDGKVSFFKVDVDENQATAEKFGVMSIPTMIIQKDGKVVDTVIGYHEKDALKKIIEKYL